MTVERIKQSFALKCASVIIISLLCSVFIFSGVALFFGVTSDVYSESSNTDNLNDILEDNLILVSNSAINRFDMENEEFPKISSNIMYEIKDDSGKTVYSDVDESEILVSVSNTCCYYIEDNEYINEVKTNEYGEVETETTFANGYSYGGKEVKRFYTATFHLKKNIQEKDIFYYITHVYNFIVNNEKALVQSVLFSGLLMLFLFIYLMCCAGHKRGEDRIYLSRFDKFPIDVLLILHAGVIFFLIFLADCAVDGITAYYNTSFIPFFLAFCIFAVAVSSILVSVFCITSAVRFKTGTFIKSSLTYRCLSFILKKIKQFFRYSKTVIRKIPTIWKSVVIIFGVFVFNLILFLISFDFRNPLLLLVFNLAVSVSAVLFCVMFSDIKNATEEIAKGNTDMKISTARMLGDLKVHAENINSINDGIAKAVEQKMKSERFKTELITNVSHDIKTPLTSIINYVDLLSKQEIDNETAKEYIEVLTRQSSKLKKLIDDLLEASKASTGNLSVNLSKIEVGIVLSQAIGEYEERFSAGELETVLNGCEEPMYISADNRHIWRIFDNVLNNIAKYAQPGTRVYIDVAENAGKAEIVFKNISKDQLNISGEELTERFVRGDSSRNTEGSGLGLSIARSLAQLQKGTFDVQIDGDLFKVKLTFPIINE